MIARPTLAAVADIPRLHARERPDAVAMVYNGVSTDYATLDRRASRVANGLIAAGIKPQTRIAQLDKNSDVFFELLFGSTKANAVLVSVNWRLAPPEIAYVINDAQAEILFVGEEFFPAIEKIRHELTTVRTIVAFNGKHAQWQSFATWRDSFPDQDPLLPIAPDDVAIQLYTSGTTGHPKGVQLANRNFTWMMPLWADSWLLNPGVSNIVCMPAFHIGGAGWGMVGMYGGATNYIFREFVPAQILDAIETHAIEVALLVPAMILFLLQAPQIRETNLSSLKIIVYGAAPMPVEVLREALKTFRCDFQQVYGLTETTGAITYLPPQDHDPSHPKILFSCGIAQKGVELRIVDGEGKDVAQPGDVGEIVVRSPQVMKGYWRLEEATRKSVRDGWFYTGDAGYVDDKGYLFIHDRVKDMIVSGGENIYPAEIENALFQHPAVADVAVIGVPDERWGEAVKAFIVRKPNTTLSQGELIEFARERIAGYKVPRSVDFLDALPRNPTGKILKRELRKPFWEGRTRQVN